MITISEKIVRLHETLEAGDIPHAFGGALALAWCTERARGTVDIDMNIFTDVNHADSVLAALPKEVSWQESDLATVRAEGQVRLWWDHTPIDIFLNTMKLHEKMALRCRWEIFAEVSVPFLSCRDLAVLKVFFDRTKDWADLEAMNEAGTLNIPNVTATIIEYLGADDTRVAKLTELAHHT
jgi:hypothetical protein